MVIALNRSSVACKPKITDLQENCADVGEFFVYPDTFQVLKGLIHVYWYLSYEIIKHIFISLGRVMVNMYFLKKIEIGFQNI